MTETSSRNAEDVARQRRLRRRKTADEDSEEGEVAAEQRKRRDEEDDGDSDSDGGSDSSSEDESSSGSSESSSGSSESGSESGSGTSGPESSDGDDDDDDNDADEAASEDGSSSGSSESGSESGSGTSGTESSDDDDEAAMAAGTTPSSPISAAEVRHAVALASEAAAETFGWNNDNNEGGGKGKADKSKRGRGRRGGGGGGNALSDVIPGYTAPLRLEVSTASASSSGATAAAPVNVATLRRRAERADASSTVVGRGRAESRAAAMLGRIGDAKTASSSSIAPSSYKTGPRRLPDPTAGSRWFGFAPDRLTDELKTDLALIRNRSYLDPKKFYKKSDRINSRMVQVGTVVEGVGEYFSSRLSKRERKSNFAEEVMADGDVAQYAKKQYAKMQRANESKSTVTSEVQRYSRSARELYAL